MSRRIGIPFLAAVIVAAAVASPCQAQRAGARGRRAAPRLDSVRVTIVGSKLRVLPVGDDDEKKDCSARGAGETGVERITAWLVKLPDGAIATFTEKTTMSTDLKEQTTRDSAARETNMPICSYKRVGGGSQYCRMHLTGRQRGELTMKELNDAEHGRHLLVHFWQGESPKATASVDAGSCLRTRNEQEDGDLTWAMADDFEREYLHPESDTSPEVHLDVGDIVFPLARPGWFRKPVPLKSADGTWTLEVGQPRTPARRR